jgi:hypothetical protein
MTELGLATEELEQRLQSNNGDEEEEDEGVEDVRVTAEKGKNDLLKLNHHIHFIVND